ncbi:MAG: HEAT repeat domain-containing protein, partial [Actinomycetota bacterium]|nr:HEAT repeat domain-containing protein [Actinomycetota bacterium]
LQASDVLMRVGSIKSLAKIGDPIAAPDLYDVATGTDAFGVRMEAAFALGQLGDPRGAKLICSMLWEEHNPYGRWYRRWASRRLVDLRAVDAIPQLD